MNETYKYPPIHEKVKARREELGLIDVDVADQLGVTYAWYDDIENYPDELFIVLELQKVRQLCKILRLSGLQLYGIDCAFCVDDTSYKPDYALQRHLLVRTRRNELTISSSDLSKRIGFREDYIDTIENGGESYIENMCVSGVLDLSRELNIPAQVFLDFKCLKCGR